MHSCLWRKNNIGIYFGLLVLRQRQECTFTNNNIGSLPVEVGVIKGDMEIFGDVEVYYFISHI
jgi:hypothetical protein